MRWSTPLLAGCVLFLSAAGALAEPVDGKWAGEIACPKLSFTPGAVKVPFELTVSGSLVTYSREVSRPDSSEFIGIEEGTGVVSHDGSVTLKVVGKSAGRKLGYTASYTGKLSGTAGTLTGTQTWTSEQGSEVRDCTITLQR